MSRFIHLSSRLIKPMKGIIPLLAIIALIAASLAWLDHNKPTPTPKSFSPKKTKVFFHKSRPSDTRLYAYSQGEATPKHQLQLKNQVEGKIVYVSPSLITGGAFTKGQLLIEIDPSDYELAVINKRANVAQAEQQLLKAQAQSAIAIDELDTLGRSQANALAKGLPQLAHARAVLASAKAQLASAELQLARTRISAPFDGRVLNEKVTTDQYISRNTLLATLFDTQVMEIRLALTGEQLSMLKLPPDYHAAEANPTAFPVTLTSQLGQQQGRWQGHIVRTEAVIDSRTRTLVAVVEVESPYQSSDEHPLPLLNGLYVNARLSGPMLNDATRLPRIALRQDNHLWLIDHNNQLEILKVSPVSRNADEVVLTNLPRGSRVITSALAIPVKGMDLKAIDNHKSQQALASAREGKLTLAEDNHHPEQKRRRKKSANHEKRLKRKLQSGQLSGGRS